MYKAIVYALVALPFNFFSAKVSFLNYRVSARVFWPGFQSESRVGEVSRSFVSIFGRKTL